MDNSLGELLKSCSENGDTRLFLNYMSLSEVPDDILQLSCLKELYLKRNLLKSLPKEINMLQKLGRLYLDANMLESIPDSIGDLKCLEFLELNRNQLRVLPSSIGNLSKLKSLHLSNNMLTVIPPEIGKLKNLETLNLMNNYIEVIPGEIGSCEKLVTFQIDGNKVKQLASELLQLEYLEDLSASGNHLQILPFDIHISKSLTDLTFDANKTLQLLPGTIIFLKNLRYLSLHGCNMLHRNKEDEIQPRIEDILEVHCLGSIDGTIIPLQELCLRFLGNAESCKSDQDGCSTLIPAQLKSRLASPIGCCTVCRKKLFSAVFILKKDQDGIIELCKSILDPSHSVKICELIKSIDSRFHFLFLFCSQQCKNGFEKQ